MPSSFLEAFEEDFDFVTDFDSLGFVEFRGGNHAFAFVIRCPRGIPVV
jgi:hypothetical protein